MLMPIILLYYTYLRHPNALLSTTSIVNMPFGTRPKRPIKRTKHVDEIHVPTADEIQVATAARLADDLKKAQAALAVATEGSNKAKYAIEAAESDVYWKKFHESAPKPADEKADIAKAYVEKNRESLIPQYMLMMKEHTDYALADAKAEVDRATTAITLEKAKTKEEREDAKAVAEHKFFEARDREERAERRLEKANDKYKLATHEREQAWVELRKYL
jgi:hypothetical protein